MLITSKNNDLIKKTIKLQNKKYRNEYNQFLIENEKILIEAFKNNYKIDTIFYIDNLKYDYGNSVKLVQVSDNVMKSISSTASNCKCVAIVNKKDGENFNSDIVINELNSTKTSAKNSEKGKHFLILDRVQDTANVGAIIRSCLGADFGCVLLIDCADIYDTKTIRASMGAIFNVPCYKVSLQDVLNLDYPLVVMDMEGENIFKADFEKGQIYGFIVGNEGQGVCDVLRKRASEFVSIPMNARLESLNASVSASIVMYAISRNLKENI